MDDHPTGLALTVAAGLATILLDRPRARNAMLLRGWLALPDLIARADADPQVAVIALRGAGDHFGAGNDIAELVHLCGDRAGAADYGRAMAAAMSAVDRATKPVIAAIDGFCYGAAVALALAADIRLATDRAQFAIPPAKLGALYLRSDLCRLVAAIGQGRARHMIYTAQPVDAARAEAWGLVDLVVPVGQFAAELATTAGAMASGSQYTVQHSKLMFRGVGQGGAQVETEESLGWFAEAMQGSDFAEGVSAFMARRAPVFPSSAGRRAAPD